jgi:alkylhydroperoxidase family enzyme
MSYGCPSQVDFEDPKIKVAVDFARKVMQTDLSVAQEDMDLLKMHFKDSEIAELTAFIAFGMGYARFGAVLSVDAPI